MPYDLFISYANKDNDRGQVRELRDAITEDFYQFADRSLRVFFDKDDIPSMADWEKRIAQGLRESRVFLAVLSPNYFASAYCRREWEEYVRYEAMRQCLGDGVEPVYFVELPGLDGPGVEQNIADWVAKLRIRQWCNLLPWYDAGKRALEDAQVVQQIQILKGEIKERLSRADRARQSPTNVYRHNPQFVGRVRELKMLRDVLADPGTVGVVGHKTESSAAGSATAVHGLGGMGKTELALAYAHAFAWDYPGGRWLARCEGLDNFDLVLRQFAEPLGITLTEEEQKDLRRAGERILAELRRRDRSLLLFDNVTHPELLGPDVLMRLPTQEGHVHLLATTRLGPAQLAGSPHDHTFVAVDELPDDDALALIRAHQPEARFAVSDDETVARELVRDLLKGFTLAVETAAIYLGRHAAPGAIAVYTERLRRELLAESEASAADPAVAVRHKEKLLERTLAITFEALSAEHLQVITLASLLPADQIALPWLRAVAAHEFPQLASEGDPDADAAWKNVEETLRGLRLFTSSEDMRVVRMHRMVQLVAASRAEAREADDQPGSGRQAENSTSPPAKEFNDRLASENQVQLHSKTTLAKLEKSLTTHVLARGNYLSEVWEEHANRWEIQPLQSTAVLWLDAKRRSGYDLACSLSLPMYELALFSESERLAQKALEFAETRYGCDSAEVARSASVLGAILTETRHLSDAEAQFRRALGIDEKLYGGAHPEVAISLSNLGALLHKAGRFSEAEPLLRRAAANLEAPTNSNRLALIGALTNLAEILEDDNRFANAEEFYRKALSLAEDLYGPEHHKVGLLLNNLASLMRAKNQVAEAETLLRRALDIAERVFGRKHPSVALRLNNLAESFREAERFDEAEPLFEEALAINEELFGPNHPEVARVLNNLAILHRETGRLKQAELQYRRALMILEGSYSSIHPEVSSTMGNLAKLLGVLGEHDESERLFRRAIEIDEILFGRDHPHLAPTLSNLAQLLCDLKQFDEAESLSREQLQIVVKVSIREKSDHMYLRTAASNYYELLRRIGLSESTALTRVDQLLRGTGFSSFGPSVSR